MRDAIRLELSPRDYAAFKRAERQRILDELLVELRRARDSGADWCVWIVEQRRARGTRR